jgi:hypothetical protein
VVKQGGLEDGHHDLGACCLAAARSGRLEAWLADERGAAALLVLVTKAPLTAHGGEELAVALAERMPAVLHLDDACRLYLALADRCQEWPARTAAALACAFAANLRGLAASRIGCRALRACLQPKAATLALSEAVAAAVAAGAEELARHWEGCEVLEAAISSGHGVVARALVRSRACVRALGGEKRWAALLAQAAGPGFPGNWRDYCEVLRSLPPGEALCRVTKEAALAKV